MYSGELLASGVLAALPRGRDHISVRQILSRFAWELCIARIFSEAIPALREPTISVVLCDEIFPDGESWRDLLIAAHHLAAPPPLIVCSQCVTDGLFEEVVGHGGFDVLQLPIRRREFVTRVMSAMVFHSRYSRASHL